MVSFVDVEFFVHDNSSSQGIAGYLVWNGGQWRDCVSLARVNPALNGYLKKSEEGKEKGVQKHRMTTKTQKLALLFMGG